MAIIKRYKEIKSFTNTKFNKNIGDFFITRPLSILLTIPFASLNITPNQITSIRIILQSVVILLIFFTSEVYFLILLILYFIFTDVLDYVDGNFARYKNKASYFGKLFDTTFDNSLNFIFLIAVLYNISNSNYSFKFFSPNYYYIFFCFYLIFFWFEKYSSLLAKQFFNELKNTVIFSKPKIEKNIKVNLNNKKKNYFILNIVNFFTFIKINVYGIAPIIFFIMGLYEEYFILLYLSFFIHFILTIPLNFKNYYSTLNIHRVSNMDLINKK